MLEVLMLIYTWFLPFSETDKLDNNSKSEFFMNSLGGSLILLHWLSEEVKFDYLKIHLF